MYLRDARRGRGRHVQSNTTSPPAPAPLLIREKCLTQITGISRGGIRALMASGKFPQPLRLGARLIAWRYVDIKTWVDSGCGRPGERGEA